VQFLVQRGLAHRRAGLLAGVARSTFPYQARPDLNADLAGEIQGVAQRHPRSGYRRVWALLRRRGRQVNKKRLHRLRKQAKLQVRKPSRKRRRESAARPPVQATHPGHVWTYDFIHDHGTSGTKLKVLTVMDEFTREGLAIEVARSMPAPTVLAVLKRLFETHGAPQFLRSDNGPEFIAVIVRSWLALHQTVTLYIEPGCPWQNGFGESFNGTVRDECLNLYAFNSVTEARLYLDVFRPQYE